MYDVFVEEIVARKPDMKSRLIKIGIFVAGILLCALSFMYIPVVFPLCFMIVVVGCYIFIRQQHVEYEYSFTNGALDVDKIMGKRRRKRLVETDQHKITLMAPYTAEYENEATSYNIKTKYDCAALSNSAENWFIIFEERDGGYGFLVFRPTERLIEAMKTYLKKKLKGA